MRLSLDARHWAVARLDETKRTETSDQPAGTYKKTHAYKGPVSTDAKHPRSRGHTSPESIQRRAVPDGFLLADTRRWAACPRARQVGELTHASTGRTCHAHPWYMLMYSYMPCSHGRSLAGAVGSNWKSTPALRERAGQPSSARACASADSHQAPCAPRRSRAEESPARGGGRGAQQFGGSWAPSDALGASWRLGVAMPRGSGTRGAVLRLILP